VTFERAGALARLEAETFDVLVVGGGITGAGVALDAASRGLRTALVERHDFASGTSSKSSKLVHGGLRYLQQKEVRLVYEALAERQVLRKTAPHLVRTLPFLLPVFTKDGLLPRRLARLLGTTMWMYDFTGGARARASASCTSACRRKRRFVTCRRCRPSAWPRRTSTTTPRPTTRA
jgi:glycerol-3-phosphate dehydrogenase